MGFVGSSWRGWATRAPDVSRGLWDTVWDWVEGTRTPPVRPVHDEPVPKLRPKPGAVPTDQHASTAPIPLTALVAVSRVDVSGLLRQRIQSGQLQTSVGIGETADITLLDDDLLAADVTLVLDRRLIIVTVSFRPGRGFSVARGHANFGVFLESMDGAFESINRYRQIDGMLPGDRVGLGSCPSDALWFSLPDVAGAQLLPRESRSPMGGYSLLYQERFRTAVLHWRYPRIQFGSDKDALVRIDDPALDGLEGVLSRKLDDPSYGYGLILHRCPVEMHLSTGGFEPFKPVETGVEMRLHGLGNRFRFGGHQVELPGCVVPSARFAGRETPTSQDIIAVFAIDPADLYDKNVVKGRYRELARMLHPDRVGDHEGHTSRFIEVQACWKAWQDLQ